MNRTSLAAVTVLTVWAVFRAAEEVARIWYVRLLTRP